MKNIKGNLFSYRNKVSAWCITTNGFVKRNKEAVMGRGCAKKASELIPSLPRILGEKILNGGNICHNLISNLYSFPVKSVSEVYDGSNVVSHWAEKFKKDDTVPGWACKAKIEIIEASAIQLRALADENCWESIIIPRAGCGAGELEWKDVDPVLSDILDDRFKAITF